MSDIRRSRRSAILSAARLEFSKKGFSGARIEEIARGAGIGKSTVYEYFPSKLDLLKGAADWMFDQVTADITSILQSTLPFSQKIHAYLLHMYGLLTEAGHGMLYMQGDRYATIEIMQSCSAHFFEIVITLMTAAIEQGKISGELREDVDAAAAAQMLCFLPSPILAQKKVYSNAQAVDDVVDLIMRGVGAGCGCKSSCAGGA